VTTAELGEPLEPAASTDPPEHQVRVALDTRLRALLRHDPGTRSGDDPEDLHQMRVSMRRMRAVLKAARPLLDRDWSDELRAELGWLGRALGPVRDLDVLLERLHREATELGGADTVAAETLLRALHEERDAARAVMLDALTSDRFTELVRRCAAAVAAPLPTRGGDGPRPELPTLVAREFRRLRRAVDAAGDNPPDVVLHDLRILGKRLRYTGELVEPALADQERRRELKRLLKATAAMQEVLGDHQDACVAQQRVRLLLDALGEEATPAVAFAAGRLVEREEARRLDTRAAWPPAWQAVTEAAGPFA
jgi:CHAD domain-containing protein